MWINDLKKGINAQSIQANKSKPVTFSDKHFALCTEEGKSAENTFRHKQKYSGTLGAHLKVFASTQFFLLGDSYFFMPIC